jgi:structural maintenance of chromosome 3 (chondroitin sulfate proteoglycan 6)
MLEIELSESLKRKRDELRTKIDSLAHVDTDDLESTGADLAAKTQELEALADSITTLQDRIAGMLFTLESSRCRLTRWVDRDRS